MGRQKRAVEMGRRGGARWWCDGRVGNRGGGAANGSTAVGVWGALTAVYILWGSTYLGIAVVVQGAPPLLSASARFFACGLIVAAIVAVRRGVGSLRITRRQLGGTALLAVLLLCIGNGGVVLAERYVPSSVSALLVASVPLFVACLRALNSDRPAAMTWAGVGFGFAGVVALVTAVGSSDAAPGDGYIDLPGWQVGLWLGVVLFGSMCWAYGSFISPRLVKSDRAPTNSITMVTWQFLIAAAVMALAGLLRGEDPSALRQVDGRTLTAWLLIVFAGVVAYSSYTWLLQNASISLASTYAYVNPVVAMFLGWLLLSEPMTPMVLAAALLIVVGVLLVVRAESSRVADSSPVSADRAIHAEQTEAAS